MNHELFGYSPIPEREPIHWPGDARVAFYVGLNVEHYLLDRPSTSIFEGTTSLVPDPLNYGWRDYGPRVAIWRLAESLDRHRIRASVLLNSDVCTRYPQIIEAFQTPALLAELGLRYVLDWTNDDQPYPLNVPGMLSVPYSVELNDVGLFLGKGLRGPDFVQIVKDQLDQLYADSAGSGRVMALALHPFVISQPFRHKYLDQALDYVTNHSGVWLTTSDEIAEHYARGGRQA
jgi:hypothetical protein